MILVFIKSPSSLSSTYMSPNFHFLYLFYEIHVITQSFTKLLGVDFWPPKNRKPTKTPPRCGETGIRPNRPTSARNLTELELAISAELGRTDRKPADPNIPKFTKLVTVLLVQLNRADQTDPVRVCFSLLKDLVQPNRTKYPKILENPIIF